MANLREPNFGVILHGHELEKLNAQLTREVTIAKDKKLINLCKRLETTLEDALSVLQCPGDVVNNARIMEKYKHNISAVLKETQEYDEKNRK